MNLSTFFAQEGASYGQACKQHLFLTLAALSCAVLLGIPIGLLATRVRWLRKPLLGFTNVLQTIPSLAVFGLLLSVPLIGGTGSRPAITTLALYSLLPIVRATVTGIDGVDFHVRRAAMMLGMTQGQILYHIELPLSVPVIFSGIRVAAVLCVGIATIASTIGAGGLGDIIFEGLRSNHTLYLWAGILPCAVLALSLDSLLSGLGKKMGFSPKHAHSFRLPAWQWLGLVLLGLATVLFLLRPPASITPGKQPIKPTTKSVSTSTSPPSKRILRIGAKDFSEQRILGELLAQLVSEKGIAVEKKENLGGMLCHQALLAQEIHVYAEYTGTAMDLFQLPHEYDPKVLAQNLQAVYQTKHIAMGPPLGFRDDFVLLMRAKQATQLGIHTLSQALPYAENWRFGMGHDFRIRADGYRAFLKTYPFGFAETKTMDLNLLYSALAQNQLDFIVGSSTDGRIAAQQLIALQDDRHFFVPYEAVFVMTDEAKAQFPEVWDLILQLAGKISTEEMTQLNFEADQQHKDIAQIVYGFRARKGL